MIPGSEYWSGYVKLSQHWDCGAYQLAQSGTPASGKATNAIEKGATEIGVRFSLIIGSRGGILPAAVIWRGNPLSRAVWLLRLLSGADKWYSSLVVGPVNLFPFGIRKDFTFLCDLGLLSGNDTSPTSTVVVMLERFISSIVRPPCTVSCSVSACILCLTPDA